MFTKLGAKTDNEQDLEELGLSGSPEFAAIRPPSRKKVKGRKLKHILEDYKKQDLQLYVVRQAHAKNARDNDILAEKESRICRTQEALLINANKSDITDMEDVLDCMRLWHAEAIQMKKAWEISESDKLLQKVFRFLRESYP